MKRTISTFLLAVMMTGVTVVFAANEPDFPSQQAENPAGDRQADRPRQLERWIDQLNQAYQEKDFQRIDRLIQRYENLRQNRQTPEAAGRRMRQQRLQPNQQRPQQPQQPQRMQRQRQQQQDLRPQPWPQRQQQIRRRQQAQPQPYQQQRQQFQPPRRRPYAQAIPQDDLRQGPRRMHRQNRADGTGNRMRPYQSCPYDGWDRPLRQRRTGPRAEAFGPRGPRPEWFGPERGPAQPQYRKFRQNPQPPRAGRAAPYAHPYRRFDQPFQPQRGWRPSRGPRPFRGGAFIAPGRFGPPETRPFDGPPAADWSSGDKRLEPDRMQSPDSGRRPRMNRYRQQRQEDFWADEF